MLSSNPHRDLERRLKTLPRGRLRREWEMRGGVLAVARRHSGRLRRFAIGMMSKRLAVHMPRLHRTYLIIPPLHPPGWGVGLRQHGDGVCECGFALLPGGALS